MVAWNRLLDPTTTLTTSVSFDWYDADDLFKSQRLFWQIMTGVHSQLTRRLTLTASVGASFANTWQDAASLGTTTFQTGARNGGVGSLGVNYRLTRTTNVYASAAQLIVPTTSGQLQKTTTAGFGINHNINDWSSLAFGAHYAHTNTGTGSSIFVGTSGDFFSAYLAYTYELARDWRARVSYAYRVRDNNTGTANASTVLLSLTYNFNLLGNPSAFDPVEKERVEIRRQRAFGQVFPALYYFR